ncbi:uncharacterized protein CC84DRAFT_65289 [Paraphaeosphaeria sporulosa]|uniref:Uncharacterized protein n=1 Tax=Paraphaeosphaeria sporulosa TaxID=1460663 RepID=A0A177CYY3_9PLEO|nr:uncharacterized protein CC84DRAFT_65289 [Paraphaeosphaeria sporulosa]OAG12040.1 hypothetical protein CC84DRAFT_65289 [Paraphaeosphaeria sporulosa]
MMEERFVLGLYCLINTASSIIVVEAMEHHSLIHSQFQSLKLLGEIANDGFASVNEVSLRTVLAWDLSSRFRPRPQTASTTEIQAPVSYGVSASGQNRLQMRILLRHAGSMNHSCIETTISCRSMRFIPRSGGMNPLALLLFENITNKGSMEVLPIGPTPLRTHAVLWRLTYKSILRRVCNSEKVLCPGLKLRNKRLDGASVPKDLL